MPIYLQSFNLNPLIQGSMCVSVWLQCLDLSSHGVGQDTFVQPPGSAQAPRSSSL